ncbi:hypothetical protein [Celerinatantimonas sp. MCCC 1A17872]|uniref:hypothetical protein n=1 Tax=Celerinatantimonas sp. MCCC 1A17872 TaxID=3177514 RepID=UPI0038BFA78C
MDFKEELESGSTPRIKKAAKKIASSRLDGYEALLLAALKRLRAKPKSWQAQSELIKALGFVGSHLSLEYLRELESTDHDASVLYKDIAFAICMISDVGNESYSYLLSILETNNDLLLSGACSAILISGVVPDESTIDMLLKSVIRRNQNEGQVITPRCYIAAACYNWPEFLTKDFLLECTKSQWSGLIEIAESSLAGKKTKYVLV